MHARFSLLISNIIEFISNESQTKKKNIVENKLEELMLSKIRDLYMLITLMMTAL